MKFGVFYELSVPRPWDPEVPVIEGTRRIR